MDKDTKVLLMAVVIILVALVSFNLNDLTGKVTTNNQASITVTPTLLTFAKNEAVKVLTINLDLGTNVVDQKVYLYKESGIRVGSESLILCRSSSCGQKDINSMYRYSINAGLNKGRYYFVARDRKNNIVAESNKFMVQ